MYRIKTLFYANPFKNKNMSNKNIAIISGGNSSEYEVSLKSAKHIYSILNCSEFSKYMVLLKGRDWQVLIDENKYPIDKNDFSFTKDGEKIIFDYAYITIHGNPGENGMLQGYFDMMSIPYSTCSTLCEAITFDKYTCTSYLNAKGIPTTTPVLLHKQTMYDREAVIAQVGLPCFVKPNAEGSSFGISKVKNIEDFDEAMKLAFSKCNDVIVESFVSGIEFTCGLYKVGGKKMIFPVVEVVPKNEFFDFEAKYDPTKSEEIVPGRFSEEITDKIQSISSEIYDILRCHGIIRVDGFVCGDDIVVLEVNTTPGMTSNSFVPKMAKAMGVELGRIISDIIKEDL